MVRRDQFDDNPAILNVKNGLLNIDSGELKQHTPSYLSLVQIPSKYDPSAKCPNILKFLADALHTQDIFTAEQIAGYCLYNSTKFEKAVMLVGPGSNGKGVFIKIIEQLVGLKNTCHATLQDLGEDKFSAADLHGKMVNTFADLESGTVLLSSMFKTLVSGDSIRAQKKHGQPFQFRNRAKLIFSANKIPESKDRSYAYYRRWVILYFDKVFDGVNRDPDLIEKLTTPEEMSGFLNLALIGLRKLRADGGFKEVSVERVKEEYESRANTVRAFLDKECVIDLRAPEYCTLTNEVYSQYVSYCISIKEKPLELNIFGKKLAEVGVEKDRSRYKGNRNYYYLGIKLRADLRGQNQVLSD
jgi:putative DNA primase/helicase